MEPEKEMELHRIAIYHEMGMSAIWERYKILPTISALSATTLVIATFNDKLIMLTPFVKVLIAVLISLIPISLISFLYMVHDAEKHAINKVIDLDYKKPDSSCLMNYLPWLITGIFTIIMVIIIGIILGISFKL